MMHFPSVSDFPPVSENFSQSVENFPNFTFSRIFFPFSSAEISDDLIFFSFFSHQPQILNSPYFRYFNTFPPISTKLFFPLLLLQIPLCFRQIYVFFTCFMYFSFPLLLS